MSIPSWARVGAKVVCVNRQKQAGRSYDLHPLPPLATPLVVASAPYISRGDLVIDIVGWVNPFGWLVSRFRPLVTKTLEQDVAAIKSMLLPADELI